MRTVILWTPFAGQLLFHPSEFWRRESGRVCQDDDAACRHRAAVESARPCIDSCTLQIALPTTCSGKFENAIRAAEALAATTPS